MRRKKNAKMPEVELQPAPLLVDRDSMISRLNKKLVDSKSGNYVIVIKKISDLRRVNINFEYYADVTMHVVDNVNPGRSVGLMVPGMGPKPIDLNKNMRLHTNVFFDWDDFEESLFEKALRWQNNINEEGYYGKE